VGQCWSCWCARFVALCTGVRRLDRARIADSWPTLVGLSRVTLLQGQGIDIPGMTICAWCVNRRTIGGVKCAVFTWCFQCVLSGKRQMRVFPPTSDIFVAVVRLGVVRVIDVSSTLSDSDVGITLATQLYVHIVFQQVHRLLLQPHHQLPQQVQQQRLTVAQAAVRRTYACARGCFVQCMAMEVAMHSGDDTRWACMMRTTTMMVTSARTKTGWTSQSS
jgi:hypothetical protein